MIGLRPRPRRIERVVAAAAERHGSPSLSSAGLSALSDGICTQLESTTASAPLVFRRVDAISTKFGCDRRPTSQLSDTDKLMASMTSTPALSSMYLTTILVSSGRY